MCITWQHHTFPDRLNSRFPLPPQGQLADRVLELLWRLAMADASIPGTAADTPATVFVEAVFAYDDRLPDRQLEHGWAASQFCTLLRSTQA